MPDGVSAATGPRLRQDRTVARHSGVPSHARSSLPGPDGHGAGATAPAAWARPRSLLILAGGLFLIWQDASSPGTSRSAMLGTLFVMGDPVPRRRPRALHRRPVPCDVRRQPSWGLLHRHRLCHLAGLQDRATHLRRRVSGLLTWVIRNFAGYPEGMAFAVLLMNSLTPIIDQYTRPRGSDAPARASRCRWKRTTMNKNSPCTTA